MIKRRKIGNTYTKSPSKGVKAWFMINLNKIFFSIFIGICYLGILWLMIKIVIFLGVNVAEVWEEGDVVVDDVYAGPYGMFFKIIGLVGIIFYVFRDRPIKR